jgi:hypothetical protein
VVAWRNAHQGAKAMKYLKVMLLAALAVYGFSAASAQAALPQFSGTFSTLVTSKSTTPSFEQKGGNLIIKCARSTGSGKVLSAKLASFVELFEGCKATIFGIPIASCKSLTATTEGDIRANGPSTLGYALGTLTVLAALEVESIHIVCGSNLISVTGCVLGQATPLASGTSGKITFKGTAGAQEFTDFTLDSGGTDNCQLASSLNGGAATASDQVQTAELTFAKAVGIED